MRVRRHVIINATHSLLRPLASWYAAGGNGPGRLETDFLLLLVESSGLVSGNSGIGLPRVSARCQVDLLRSTLPAKRAPNTMLLQQKSAEFQVDGESQEFSESDLVIAM